jgi:hypothetical protein
MEMSLAFIIVSQDRPNLVVALALRIFGQDVPDFRKAGPSSEVSDRRRIDLADVIAVVVLNQRVYVDEIRTYLAASFSIEVALILYTGDERVL